MSFDTLKTPELREAAKAFAVDDEEVISKSNAPTLKAALGESGVTWDMYLQMFRPDEYAELHAVKPAPTLSATGETIGNNVISTESMIGPVETEVTIVTKEEHPKLSPEQPWLIKMERDNPYFEFIPSSRTLYKFTQANPYHVMPAADAEEILHEEGFRQARPSEVQEYYN